MYKYFDILVGVTQMRQAFATDPIMMSKMAQVFDGQCDIDGASTSFLVSSRNTGGGAPTPLDLRRGVKKYPTSVPLGVGSKLATSAILC